MTYDPVCTWTGASGTAYIYYVRPLGSALAPNQTGNFIYAKKNPEGDWLPIYIGQGDLSESERQLLDARDATHVHMHLTMTEEARLAEERDLLARYPNEP